MPALWNVVLGPHASQTLSAFMIEVRQESRFILIGNATGANQPTLPFPGPSLVSLTALDWLIKVPLHYNAPTHLFPTGYTYGGQQLRYVDITGWRVISEIVFHKQDVLIHYLDRRTKKRTPTVAETIHSMKADFLGNGFP